MTSAMPGNGRGTGLLALLAVDETEESIEAARAARALFGSEATYLAVNVADQRPRWTTTPLLWGGVYPFPWAEPYPPTVDAAADRTEEAMAAAHSTAEGATRDAGVTAETRVEIGDPVDAVLDAAQQHDADVIVVGSSMKRWWQRLFDRSVSQEILEAARRPVLVVPHAMGEGGDR